MDGHGRGWGWGRNASVAAAVLALGPPVARAGGDGSNVRLVRVVEKATVARALDGAARKLARPACEALVDEFKGVSGQPLRAALEESGRSASEYVAWIFFYDAPPSLCRSSELAVTKPGSRAILVCGSRFVRQMATDSRHAEATLIHEAFHSLGLGETPPRRTTSRSGSRHAVGDGEPPRPAPYSSFRSTKHFR